MYELSVAFKYLIPRWRQLSVSMISLISIAVIALVVWLIVVFFSVTYGLERVWVGKLVALTAPIRVTPTDDYYKSYYYLIDSISEQTDYTLQSIGEKGAAYQTDPYNPDFDQEPPFNWPLPDRDDEGNLKDLVKLALGALGEIDQIVAKEYETAIVQLRLEIQRGQSIPGLDDDPDEGSRALSHNTYLSVYDASNPALFKTLFPVTEADIANLYSAGDEEPGSKVTRRQLHELLQEMSLRLPESLPSDTLWGDAVLLPKSWKESGALIGDRGRLVYQAATVGAVQEQRIPVYVAGFFDPGILPMGGRVILANPQVVSAVRSATPGSDSPLTNGLNVWFSNLDDAEKIKDKIETAFRKQGIENYWKVETYREFEFTKDFLQQLKSERNLFTLISMVIIIVACSNIVSMLIILVNDKKMEIGILRSMGASSQSIAAIFGFCGMAMGLTGSAIGIGLALFTLQHLQALIDLISRLQGFEMFNPTFFGETLPNEVSMEALGFVMTATVLVSLVAGVVPAIKASLLRPSAILRSE